MFGVIATWITSGERPAQQRHLSATSLECQGVGFLDNKGGRRDGTASKKYSEIVLRARVVFTSPKRHVPSIE